MKEIKLGNPSEIERLHHFFSSSYNADTLKSYLSSIWRFIPEHPVVTRNGESVDSSKYFPNVKAVSYLRKSDCVGIISLLHSHPDNIRWLLALMPAYVGVALRMAISYGRVSQTLLEEAGASKAISLGTDYWWNRNMKSAPYMELFDVSEGTSHRAENYGIEWYLSIPSEIVWNYSVALVPDVTYDGIFFPDGGAGCGTASAEKEFVSSFPTVEGLFRQGELKNVGLKMSSASAMKVLKMISVPELVPAAVMTRHKVTSGQYFLPAVSVALLHLKSCGAAECVREAFSILRTSYSAMLLPAMLPHIKGFRATGMPKARPGWWAELMGQCLEDQPDAWLSLEELRTYVYACPTGAFLGTPVFDRWKMELQNTLSDEKIFPDTQWKDIDLAVIRGIAAAMFGMGLVEVSWCGCGDEQSDPLEHIRRIRLTALGRYALGLSESYDSGPVEIKEWFRLDNDHLIVSSVRADNPYEPLLNDIAEPIGSGRYKIDSSSFLKKCSKGMDVKEKIEFFKNYVSSDQPEIWKDFFSSIEKRCGPFVEDRAGYVLLKVGENSPELVRILSSEPEIRKLIILVEGGRFLVSSQNYKKFVSLMKDFGWLV